MTDKLILGVSACLLGHEVRYDGGHKYDSWVVDILGKFAEYIHLCPEHECGMPIPREALNLKGSKDDYRIISNKTSIDYTQQMQNWSITAIERLKQIKLCGYILKSKSPSCGMERVKVYPPHGGAAGKTGIGIFAKELMKAFPLLPIEEEGRLHDAALRENFIERVFVMHRWHTLLDSGLNPGKLLRFHTIHKYLLMAHSPVHYRQMGKLVAEIKQYPLPEFKNIYLDLLMKAFSRSATPSKQQNVLLHLLGYFKQDLDAFEKQELISLISKYKEGLIPLIVPITLINHYVRKYQKQYLADQVYLMPHPMELKLRNHV
ncbi:MAG: DUF523 and DUF1722 domain-containing protein [Candidatus Cloacimonadaceae bacterium]|jgi:uncharacterized protein YbgA (DUF1722 family)/uncharacterized protein YbbK (DUF523 family)|nr:DUF523 and DUF1722 domain-containing protein [Candidatus Cloacimonadaceae bacterium]